MGCKNSTGESAWLHGYGDTSLIADEIEFVSAGLVPGQAALLFQGSTKIAGGNGQPFGNGLRCVGGTVQRLGVRIPDSAGTATWDHLIARAGWTPGQTGLLQVYYRDTAGGPCGNQVFNTTNGYELTLTP